MTSLLFIWIAACLLILVFFMNAKEEPWTEDATDQDDTLL